MATSSHRGSPTFAAAATEQILQSAARKIEILVAREEITVTRAEYAAGLHVAEPHLHHDHVDGRSTCWRARWYSRSRARRRGGHDPRLVAPWPSRPTSRTHFALTGRGAGAVAHHPRAGTAALQPSCAESAGSASAVDWAIRPPRDAPGKQNPTCARGLGNRRA